MWIFILVWLGDLFYWIVLFLGGFGVEGFKSLLEMVFL